ncbi:MAG: hypothetical protein K9G76_02125 [Bacteroidales bacterium]|nr:hypothetical protein [Bacteroidales bacterium]MCF8405681.1 hypothetical protein [Bacteroidales bacterium]
MIFIPIAYFLIQTIQAFTGFIKVKPLGGVSIETEVPALSLASWFNQSFQDELTNYIDFNFGFRPFYIRVYNQIQYSLFRRTNVQSISIGKEGYLYENLYVQSYFGNNFIGEQTIDNNIVKLEEISRFLQKSNTELLIIIAPSKAYFYPEYLPEKLISEKKTNNYEYYVKALKQSSIHFIDFNRWFLDQKSGSDYPLMTKNGIHWSEYGAILAADSILKSFGSIFRDNIPNLTWNGIEMGYKPASTDKDLERLMNLIFPLPDNKSAYPVDVSIISDSSDFKPRAIFIGDSFFWNIYYSAFTSAFESLQFWYYNKLVVPDVYNQSLEVDDLDMIGELKKNDIVVLISSTVNLENLGFRFIDNVYNFLHKDFFEKRAQYIESIKNSILTSPPWLEAIKQKAIERNIPLDSMIMLDATYMADIRMEEYKKQQSE